MKYKKTTAFTFAFSCVLAGGIISVCANNDEIYTGDAQSTLSTSDSETMMLTQEEKFDILSKCTTREKYTDL